MGATWEEVSLPHSKYALATYYLLSSSEASANLSRFDGVRYGVRSDNVNNLLDLYKTHVVKVSVMKLNVVLCLVHLLLALVTMMHITKAQQVRTLIKNDFENVFANYDVIIGPTTPTPAFKVGEKLTIQ